MSETAYSAVVETAREYYGDDLTARLTLAGWYVALSLVFLAAFFSALQVIHALLASHHRPHPSLTSA